MLALEVEYLNGVVYAADDQGSGPDWPPQPDRLFSALVASWAARGQREDERAALEWLEAQEPPRLTCSPGQARSLVKVYVPPNDDSLTSPTILPARRRRQERQFPAWVPHDPVVQFTWCCDPEPPVFRALAALARDTSYLGHSSSLVRCRPLTITTEPAASLPARRQLHRGRLQVLERAFDRGERPPPGETVPLIREKLADVSAPDSVFGRNWIILAHQDGWRPDALGAALAAKQLLKTVQSGYGPAPAPEWVSGHAPDGRPSAAPHLAVVPLLNVGWTWSDGQLMGLALVLPRTLEAAIARTLDPEADPLSDDDLAAAAAEAALHRALGRRNQTPAGGLTLTLKLPREQLWTLVREARPLRASLKPGRYLGPARRWATVTPIALDRHPKAEGEVEASIAAACERIGLPRPERIIATKHAAVAGAVSARRSARAPAWTGWQLPSSLAGRPLTHAVIEFAEPVAGPVILGAGRFVGLGLCLECDPRPSSEEA